MNKLLYISTLVLSITVYMAQGIAASQETSVSCGKRLSATFKILSLQELKLDGFMKAEDEFCDKARDEFNANYEITFYDQGKQKIYGKKVFLSPTIKVETIDKKGKFIASKEIMGSSRIITMEEEDARKFKFYSIKSLQGKESVLMMPIEKVESFKIQEGEVIDVNL